MCYEAGVREAGNVHVLNYNRISRPARAEQRHAGSVAVDITSIAHRADFTACEEARHRHIAQSLMYHCKIVPRLAEQPCAPAVATEQQSAEGFFTQFVRIEQQ